MTAGMAAQEESIRQVEVAVVSDTDCDAFQRDGAIKLTGIFTDWVEVIRDGIARNMSEPGPYASENAVVEGRFFDDYCNWTRIPEFQRVIEASNAGRIAAKVMASRRVQFFHDHVLVKEAATPKPTPWHQDGPYYFIDGEQTVSFWIPVDPVRENTLRFIAGSHRWSRMVRPVSWADDSDFYEAGEWIPVPDPDAHPKDFKVLEWSMDPGDAVLFHYKTVHGARGNQSTSRRRALSLRFFGDDARFVERISRTSPPFPGHGMRNGDQLRSDWFPFVFNCPEKA